MDIFPTGLDNSLFPAIFVGVLVAFAATETFGWTFTGLVVPGYLSSVALVSPIAAVLMLAEALVAVAIVRLVSDGASRLRVGSRFFGRERFFLVLVVATGVRLVLDRTLGGLFQAGGDETAHSIGLVLVPLLAHTLDKNGPARGLTQICALSAVTGAIVALLIATTNLTLADLSLTFDDVAYAIEQHPKAYLVLLCGAFLAARANVAFGWDFHGIIVPGLLAVAWFDPAQVGVTLVEAMAALLLARGLTRLPGLRRFTFDGPRRLVLVFFADAILKVVIVGLLSPRVPMLKPSDLYGFGYLLPALLADKMWQKLSVVRVILPAMQVSLGGFLLGNLLVWVLGHGLSWMAPAAEATAAAPPPTDVNRALAVARAGVARDGERTRLSAAELRRWRAALDGVVRGEAPATAFARVATPGVAVRTVDGEPGAVVVAEEVARLRDLRGLGTLWLRPTGRHAVVAVPRPLDGDLTLVAGDVARALDARAVVISGRPDGGALAVLPTSRTPYQLAVEALDGDAWIELAVDESAPPAGRIAVGPASWPEQVRLSALHELLPGAEVSWNGEGRAIVVAAPAATWRAVAARPCAAAAAASRSWPQLAAAPDVDDGFAPVERLLYAESIVAPLAELARGGGDVGASSACRAASALGLEVATILDGAGGRHLAVLPAERWAAPVILRAGAPASVETIVAAPRANVEPLTDRAALTLARRLDARAVVIGAPGPAALLSTSDAAIETLAGHLGSPGAEATVIEIRGGGFPRGAVLSWGGVAGEPAVVPSWLAPVARGLAAAGMAAEPYSGRAEHACCGDLASARRALLAQVGRARVASVYLSESLRETRFLDGGATSDAALAVELGLAEQRAPLPEALALAQREAECLDVDAAARDARRWAELGHVADLRRLAARPGVKLVRDPLSEGSFVVAASRCDGRDGAVVVSLRDGGGTALASAPDAKALDDLRWGRATALVWRNAP